MKCDVCSKDRELRLGFCWPCAEAQSIIHEGLDMEEVGNGGKTLTAKEATDRLKMLIAKGWTC